ncbi:MAG: hypothetical protein II984_00545 [Clostridia bacterium]|nr:hypothetical protein [Clostridia bacterium]
MTISVNVAKDAPKESGLVIIKGKISSGTPILSNKGASQSARYSVAPEAKSILTPIIKAHIDGKSLIAPSSPFFAPRKKKEK